MLGTEDTKWGEKQARSLPWQSLLTFLVCLTNSYASFKTQLSCHFLLDAPSNAPTLDPPKAPPLALPHSLGLGASQAGSLEVVSGEGRILD